MLIKVLSEHTSLTDEFLHEHGLSIYIETEEKKILFDTGASDVFAKNARKMDVDISKVDYLIISHAHDDHAGGMEVLLRENPKVKVFLHRLAGGNYYSRTDEADTYIGLDKKLLSDSRIVWTSESLAISDGIYVFSDVVQKYPKPMSNQGLFMECGGEMVPDEFSHEQNLLIEENGRSLLLTGCSHNGVMNILERFKEIKGKMPDVCIGGFHLYKTPQDEGGREYLEKIGRRLLATGIQFYTGHCTGKWPFERLKETMGSKIDYLPAGSILLIE